MPLECLVRLGDRLDLVVLDLLNEAWRKGEFPAEWRTAVIVPIPKPKAKDRTQPGNYRGISLLPCLGKLMAAVLNARLQHFMERWELLCEEQAGFRQGRSTIDQILTLQVLIDRQLRERRGKAEDKRLYVAFVDFAKAYDYVPRELLMHKLLRSGIQGRMHTILRSMYTSVKAKVRTADGLSDAFVSELGLRQGCILSPLLFAFYISDFPKWLRGEGDSEGTGGAGDPRRWRCTGVDLGGKAVHCLMYADDIALTARTAGDLQKMLDALHEYCRRWQLFVNVAKTEVVVFRGEGEVADKFSYNGEQLKVVDFFRYLGVVYSSSGKVDQAIKTRVTAANKVFGMFVRRVTAWMFDPPMGSRLYTTYIRPILLYGSEVWGVQRQKPLEGVLADAGRVLLGLPRHTPTAAVLGELGWHPVWTTAQVSVLRYVFGLLRRPASRLVCRALRVAVRMGRHAVRGSWGYALRKMLATLDMHEEWRALADAGAESWADLGERALQDAWQGVGKARVLALAEREWWESVSSEGGVSGRGGNKLRKYRLVKQRWGVERYLKLVRQFPVRRLLARLRSGVLRLRLEEGRFEAARAEQRGQALEAAQKEQLRHCPFCPGCVEDEVHFVSVCPVYGQLRSDLWGRVQGRVGGPAAALATAEGQYVALLAAECPAVIKAVARFVYGAWRLRQQKLGSGEQ